MDSINKAVELARAAETSPATHGASRGFVDESRQTAPGVQAHDFRLNPAHLEANRIVTHGSDALHGRYYDMLRTQILQEMDKKNWQFLAVTSPTAGCGKSVTACNLALSIARLPDRSVLLVDLDLHKPTIAKYLGIKEHSGGVLSVLEGRVQLSQTIIQASIGPTNCLVIPGESTSSGAADWLASQTMNNVLQTIKRDYRSCIVIFDLPPLLLGDDVISILPRMDATILVASVGSTSVADIKESQKYLQKTSVVRVVVNKATEPTDAYYGSY